MPDVPLQRDLFSSELVDTRNRRQIREARQRNLPCQMEMFSIRETVQPGIRAHPIDREALYDPRYSPGALRLVQEDTRTDEEKELARIQAIHEKTIPMFAASSTETCFSEPSIEVVAHKKIKSCEPEASIVSIPVEIEPEEPIHSHVQGLRKTLRQQSFFRGR